MAGDQLQDFEQVMPLRSHVSYLKIRVLIPALLTPHKRHCED